MASKLKKNNKTDFVILFRALIADRRISDGAFRLYCYLEDRKNDKHGGIVWVNQSTMAADLHLSVPSITKRLDELEDLGLVIPEKLKFWPESGDRVIGRNKLKYKVLSADMFYTPEEIRKNWNWKEKEAEVSKSKETIKPKTKEIFASNTKETFGSIEQELANQELSNQEICEQALTARALTNENIFLQEGIKINEEECKVLIHYQNTLIQNHRIDFPFKYNKKDIHSITQAIDRFGVEEILLLISHAIENWCSIQERHPSLYNTFFTLNTLGSGWLDALEVDRVYEERMARADKFYRAQLNEPDHNLDS